MDNEKRSATEMIGDFFQAIADLIDSASTPVYNLIAVTIPFVAPIVIANIVSAALVRGGIVDATEAKYLAFVLEGIGIVGLAGLVLSINAWIKSKNPKTESMIWLLGVIDAVYFIFLVAVVVLLDASNPNVTGLQTFVRALICLVPLMADGIFGYHRLLNQDKIEKRDEKQEAYIKRQEAREDKLKGKAIKAGFNPFATTVNQQVVDGAKEKVAGDYKAQAIEYLDELWGAEKRIATPRELTTYINKKYRVSLDHNKCKGTWSNFTKLWKASRGL